MTVFLSAVPSALDEIIEIMTEELRPTSLILKDTKDPVKIARDIRQDFMSGESDLWSAMRRHAVEFEPSAQLAALIIRLPSGVSEVTRESWRELMLSELVGIPNNHQATLVCITVFDDLIDSLHYHPTVAQKICSLLANYAHSNVGNQHADMISAVETLSGYNCRTVLERHADTLAQAVQSPAEELAAVAPEHLADLTDLRRYPFRLDLRRLVPEGMFLTPSAAVAIQEMLRTALHELAPPDTTSRMIMRITALRQGGDTPPRPSTLLLTTHPDGVIKVAPPTST